MLQTIITTVIVAAALFFAVRWLVRTSRSKGGCACGCQGCPHSGGGGCHCADKPASLPDIDPDAG